MGSPAKKKVRIIQEYNDEDDRISRLPNELIHKILSFVDAKEAVQTSVLLKRWKLIWVTLPFLNFDWYEDSSTHNTYMFIRHVLSKRDHKSQISALNLCVLEELDECLLEKFVEYAISHNVEYLNIELGYHHKPYKLPTFSSGSLRKLTLQLEFLDEPHCWNLPVLTTLRLKSPDYNAFPGFSDSCLTCLPALTTLCLENWDFSYSSFSFSLPKLTTLLLSGRSSFRQTVWNFPALSRLVLNVRLPDNINHILSTLVNLKNLTIFLSEVSRQHDLFISCPQLLNLNLTVCCSVPPTYSIVVLTPKLCSFASYGIFSVTFGVLELQDVSIKLQGWFELMKYEDREKYHLRFTNMLLGVGNAKSISFDYSIEVLSAISDFLASVPSPFCKLMYVKLPQGYKVSSISSALRSYLLGGSPKATIVTSLPRNMISQIAAVSATAENAVLHEPLALAAPTKELVGCQYMNRTLSIHTVGMGVQEQHVVKNSLVDADRVNKIDSPVERTSNDRVSSTKGYRDIGVWRGHEVNSEFVLLLDLIMYKYPETFEHFTTKNKKLCTVRLNMLCSSLNEFTKISMPEVDSEIIVEYRDRFACLQNMGFNLSWVVTRLNYIHHLRFSKPLISELHAIDVRMDDAKSKVQDLQAKVDDAKILLQNLQTLRAEKMTEIQKEFGTMGTNLAVGFIGDDLLSGP